MIQLCDVYSTTFILDIELMKFGTVEAQRGTVTPVDTHVTAGKAYFCCYHNYSDVHVQSLLELPTHTNHVYIVAGDNQQPPAKMF